MSNMRSGPGSDLTDLIEAARRGDLAAFGELYRIYLGDIRDFCARRIHNPLRAEDLAQETFLRAYESIGAFRSGSPFWPWLSTIARNLCIDELRSRSRTKEESSADPPETAPRDASTDVTAEEAVTRHSQERIRVVLNSALERLSARDRQMLWSHVVEQKSWEQIAQANGATVHAVRNSTWRARNRLRTILGDSLRDLRSRVALPLAVLAAQWRRLRNRWRSRVSEEYGVAVGIAFERAASLLGVVVVSVAILSAPSRMASEPSVPGPRVLGATIAEWSEAALAVQQMKPAKATTPNEANLGPVDAMVSAKSREGAATPSAATYRIEVYGPTGQLLYAEETAFKCGDGRASALVPSASPIQAYC